MKKIWIYLKEHVFPSLYAWCNFHECKRKIHKVYFKKVEYMKVEFNELDDTIFYQTEMQNMAKLLFTVSNFMQGRWLLPLSHKNVQTKRSLVTNL